MRPSDMRKASVKGDKTPSKILEETLQVPLAKPPAQTSKTKDAASQATHDPKKKAAEKIASGSRSRMARSRMLGHS